MVQEEKKMLRDYDNYDEKTIRFILFFLATTKMAPNTGFHFKTCLKLTSEIAVLSF